MKIKNNNKNLDFNKPKKLESGDFKLLYTIYILKGKKQS